LGEKAPAAKKGYAQQCEPGNGHLTKSARECAAFEREQKILTVRGGKAPNTKKLHVFLSQEKHGEGAKLTFHPATGKKSSIHFKWELQASEVQRNVADKALANPVGLGWDTVR